MPIGYLPLYLTRHAQVCDGHACSLTGEHQDLEGKTWKDIIEIWLVLNDDNYGTQYLSPVVPLSLLTEILPSSASFRRPMNCFV